MAEPLYQINGWRDLYETNETRKLKSLLWVKVPNKMDGLSFKLLAKRPDACEIFSAWILMLQIASKSDPRGDLAHNGIPLSPGEMGEITGFPGEIFVKALEFLSSKKMGWISVISPHPETPGENPDAPGKSPATPPVEEGREWNGREEKGMEGKETRAQGISEIAKAAYDAYPDTAKKDGRPTGKGIVALNALTLAVQSAPDFPWVEYAGLIRDLVATPRNLASWAQIGADELGLQNLRRARAATSKPSSRSAQASREYDENIEF